MPRSGPRQLSRYSDEFKLTAVRFSQQPGMQVQTVAAALEIHPFMLSKWRKDVKDGRLRGRPPKAPSAGPAREIAQWQALERKYAELKEEHDLLKNAIRFWSARKASGSPSSTPSSPTTTASRSRSRPSAAGTASRPAGSTRGGVDTRVRGYRAKAGSRARFAQHPNRVWETDVDRVNRVWVGDITDLRVATGWRYLAIVMDQDSRRILAWLLSRRRTTRETCRGLGLALTRRRPPGDLIVHSDRGTEYTSGAFCTFVARHGVTQSLSVRGPEDNAHMESFFHSLKAELTRGAPIGTERQLRRALDTYVRYDNARRFHSALGYRSPIAFEREAA